MLLKQYCVCKNDSLGRLIWVFSSFFVLNKSWKWACFICFTSDGLATFRNFLKSEYSDENIEFWLTCEDYKKIKSSFRMSSRAKKIYEQFIKAESPKEVTSESHTDTVSLTYCLYVSVQAVLWKRREVPAEMLNLTSFALGLNPLIPTFVLHSRSTSTITPESRSKGTSRLPPCTALTTLRRSFTGWWKETRTRGSSARTFIELFWRASPPTPWRDESTARGGERKDIKPITGMFELLQVEGLTTKMEEGPTGAAHACRGLVPQCPESALKPRHGSISPRLPATSHLASHTWGLYKNEKHRQISQYQACSVHFRTGSWVCVRTFDSEWISGLVASRSDCRAA